MVMKNDYREILDRTVILVKKIGKLFDNKVTVAIDKNPRELVTELDKEISLIMEKELYKIFKVEVVSEEGNTFTDSGSYWVVDPIDGTTNFIKGTDNYTISVGLVVNGKTQLGIVYQPSLDRLYSSIRGEGSYLNNNKIEPRQKIINSGLVATIGFPYDESKIENVLNLISILYVSTKDIKRIGPASLDIVRVALGESDLYMEYDLKEWDISAGKLIAEELGVTVKSIDINGDNIIAVYRDSECDYVDFVLKKIRG